MASFGFLHCVLFFLFAVASMASSSLIKYHTLDPHGLTGRNLLQQQKACPLDFENMNYTIITSQCKGPVYKPQPCCNSLLELSCPHAEDINDDTTNCATTLFSYINLYGKYPPGLFASMCKDGKEGLSCEAFLKSHPDQKNSAAAPNKSSLMMITAAGFFAFVVFNLF